MLFNCSPSATKNLNSRLLISIKAFSGTTNACISYTAWDMRKILIIHIFPTTLKFLFSQINISLLIFTIRSDQFSSIWDAHLKLKKYTPRISSFPFQLKPKKVSVHVLLLPSHMACDFVLLTSKPENTENSQMTLRAWCMPFSSFRNNVISSAYKAILIISSV